MPQPLKKEDIFLKTTVKMGLFSKKKKLKSFFKIAAPDIIYKYCKPWSQDLRKDCDRTTKQYTTLFTFARPTMSICYKCILLYKHPGTCVV